MINLKHAVVALGLVAGGLQAQELPYTFTEVIDLETSDVKSQDRTGTCWSFSTTSFLESELERMSGKTVDLSEMFFVHETYQNKAKNYVYRQGAAQFGEGSLNHDVMDVVAQVGMVPQSAYAGIRQDEQRYNHSELVAVLKAMVATYAKNPGGQLSNVWLPAYQAVLDVYLGKRPESFTYEGKEYTPETFRDAMGIRVDDYISLTSFSHLPYYEKSILNIPDNWSNGAYYNLPLNQFMEVIDHALETGYSVAYDADVSEKTFSAKNGMAIWPVALDSEKLFKEIVAEHDVDQEMRQAAFFNFDTTDDHLMHITGLLKDQNGVKYYKVKNSWGAERGHGGYVYSSEAYVRMKTVGILIHKEALSKAMRKKLGIK